MATHKPLGPIPMKGMSIDDMERIYIQLKKLASFVPRDLAERLMGKVLDEIEKEIAADNTVLFTKSNFKEMAKEIRSEKIFKTHISQFKKWARKIVGKRTKDLPKPSAKEKRKRLKAETNNFVITLAKSYINTMWLLDENKVVRLDELLLPVNPNKKIFNELSGYSMTKLNSWLEIVMLSTVPLITDGGQNQVLDIYKAFIANLKAEVDKFSASQREIVLMDDVHKTLILGHDDQGYFLKIVDKPQTQ